MRQQKSQSMYIIWKKNLTNWYSVLNFYLTLSIESNYVMKAIVEWFDIKKASSGFPYLIWPQMVKIRQKQPKSTFFLSRIDPFPRTMILQPVSCSNCLVVIPRGPNMRPTKLNWKKKKIYFTHLLQYDIKKKKTKNESLGKVF